MRTMARITKKELARMLGFVAERLPEPKVGPGKWTLETWAPGDGVTRYRLAFVTDKEHGEYNPLGERYWLGASEAWEGLNMILRTLQYVNGAR